MASGGSRPRSGPLPDVNALNRARDKRDWVRLPKKGCTLDPPEWPVEFSKPSVSELSLWHRLWKTPQAIVWHNDGMTDFVVVYLRVLLIVAEDNAPATLLTQFRQLAEHLLLTTPALRAARFFIEGGPEESFMDDQDPDRAPENNTVAATGTEDASSVMKRFTIVRPQDDEDDNGDPSAIDE